MDLYSSISKSHEEDFNEMQKTIIDYQISVEDKTRKKYENDVQKMQLELSSIKQKDEDAAKDADDLEEELKDFQPPPDEAYQLGDFFHRLNACEVSEAQYNGRLDGIKQNEKNMTQLIKKQELINEKLNKKFESICDEIPGGFVDPLKVLRQAEDQENTKKTQRAAKKEEITKYFKASDNKECIKMKRQLVEKKSEIDAIDAEFKEISDAIGKYQNDIKSVAKEIKENQEYNLDVLILQNEELTKEIMKKKEQLHKIEEEYKEEQAKAERSTKFGITDHEKLDRKSTKYEDRWLDRQKAVLESKNSGMPISSDGTWTKDREALLNSILTVRTEIKNLKKQNLREESAQSKRSQKLEADKKSLDGCKQPENTKLFLRQAMQMELDLIESGNHPVVQAIENEKKYGQKLDNELLELEKTSRSIEEFSKKLFGNRTGNEADDDYNNKKQRIDMLKAELAELRAQIGE